MTAQSPRWVLGVDAVSSIPGAALWQDGVVVAARTRSGEALVSSARPGERLAGCVLGVMEDLGIGVDALSGVAVTVGPGSFTGIRVGLSIVHGLLQGTSAACAPIGTCEATREAERVLSLSAPDCGAEGAVGDCGESNMASPVVLIQLRKTDWFVQLEPGDEPRLANAEDSARAVGGRRALVIGAAPNGVEGLALTNGLAAAVAALGASSLRENGWPRMDTAHRVRVLLPEYRRDTYVKESRGS